jgi:hypothetical protein
MAKEEKQRKLAAENGWRNSGWLINIEKRKRRRKMVAAAAAYQRLKLAMGKAKMA